MNEEEKLSLNNYIDDLYQAMQIGDIVFEPKHSSELYNLINKLQQELQKYKSLYQNEKDKNDTLNRVIKKIEEYIKSQSPDAGVCGKTILDLLKEIK